jgi:hypothetical protein
MTPQPGYVFFTTHPGIIAHGISYFSRWGAGKVRVTHSGIFAGKDSIIQAHMSKGVHRASWANTLKTSDPERGRKIYLAVPKGWTPELGQLMVANAEKYIGQKYDVSSIFALAASNTLLGRALGSITRGGSDRLIGRILNGKNKWFCSEVVAQAGYETFPAWKRQIDREDPHMITPQKQADNAILWDIQPTKINPL